MYHIGWLFFLTLLGVAIAAQVTFNSFVKKGFVAKKAAQKGILVLSTGFSFIATALITLMPLVIFYAAEWVTDPYAQLLIVTIVAVSSCLRIPAAFAAGYFITWWTVRSYFQKKYGKME